MTFLKHTFALLFFASLFPTATAQKWISTNFGTHHLDYRDLGYPNVSEIPADNSRISALAADPGGYIFGATSGKQSYFFVFDPYINKVRPLGKIPGSQGVHHTLAAGEEGKLYIGTGLNLLDEIPLSQDIPGGHRMIETYLWKDILAYHEGFEGGHIYVFDPDKDAEKVKLPQDNADLTDLGIVHPGNSIYALVADDQYRLYGITYPGAHFFSVDTRSKKIVDHGPLLDTMVYSGPERTWRSVPRDLHCLPDGRVITSGNEGFIVVFDPETQSFTNTGLRIPGEYWESWNYYGYPVVEQFVQGKDGLIYGSTNDGYIFSLHLDQNELINFGKPRVTRRTRAMTMGHDDNLYMICGEIGEPNKLYSFDPKAGSGFTTWGGLSVDRSPYYAKRAYQFDAMAVGPDGTLYLGESDRRGKLFIFLPGAEIFPGGLNKKNPR